MLREMKKLGYLISQRKLREVADFIEITDDINKFDEDSPAIIIGLENARKAIKNFSILKKNPYKNKFWTFDKNERRSDFNTDIEKFYNYVLSSNINAIKYYYVDILTLSKEKVKNLLKILSSSDDKYIYVYKEMLYLYHKNYILGISLSLLKYCNKDVKKLLKKVSKNKATKIYYSDANISAQMRQYAKNKRYITPYFLSLVEDK